MLSVCAPRGEGHTLAVSVVTGFTELGPGVDFGGSGGIWQADFFKSFEMYFPFCFYLFIL